MKKILVPVDFSDVSENATQFAIELAEKHDSEITLFNSVHFDYFTDYQFSSFSTAKTLMDDIHDAMKEKMEGFTKRFQTRRKINSIISPSHLITAIKEMVNDRGYDLVVVGTSGCSGLEEALIGSNTERVVRHTPCPVISVPKKTSVSDIKKIIVPIDLREIKSSFLKQIASLQKKFDAELDFLWIKTPHNIENEELVQEELTNLISSHGMNNFVLTIEHNVFPSDGILWHADDTNANMIAMATHARRGLSHWFSGSLTEDTVNHIDIPVWSFRLDKKEKSVTLDSVKNAQGKPEYKKIEVLTTD